MYLLPFIFFLFVSMYFTTSPPTPQREYEKKKSFVGIGFQGCSKETSHSSNAAATVSTVLFNRRHPWLIRPWQWQQQQQHGLPSRFQEGHHWRSKQGLELVERKHPFLQVERRHMLL
jgi:hypothetical protein